MKIKMLKTSQYAPDGITIITYWEGREYDVPRNVGEALINCGWAVLECGDTSPPSQNADESAQSNGDRLNPDADGGDIPPPEDEKDEKKDSGQAPENKKADKTGLKRFLSAN